MTVQLSAVQLSDKVVLERRGNIALVWCDNPPVNLINRAIRAGLHQAMRQIGDDATIAASIVICRGRGFFAGADISEFGQADPEPGWRKVDRAIEGSAKPVIAAIHGNCLGGGFEIALACHYRLADSRASFGFPEVKLGLIPGAGGTQRFPRLAGFAPALDVIPSGRTFGAAEALAFGAIDAVVDNELAAEALAFARRILQAGQPLPRARERGDKIAPDSATSTLFAKAREAVAKRQRGFAAPLAAIRSIENAGSMSFEAGWEAEADLFAAREKTAEHRALSHLFFAEREARRVPDLSADTPAKQITRAAIIGGGTMGQGIALAFAEKDISVTLIEVSPEAGAKALDSIAREIDAGVARGRIDDATAERRRARIEISGELSGAASADIVIEAVFEDLDLKKKIFTALDVLVAGDVPIASNTSNLDINQIAAVTRNPGRVLGLHFFSPAHVMKLLEIVRGEKTDPAALATALGLARQLGKQPVVARVCDGFIANRIFDQYWRQSRFLVEEGASPYDIDKALYDFGMPMGPFAVNDLVGLDVAAQIRRNRRHLIPAGVRLDTIEDELAEQGRFGRKNGRGWYLYANGARAGSPDPAVLAHIEEYRRRHGFTTRAISAGEIVERCIFAAVNEGAKEIEEGIAIRASDIDVAAVNGYGFPRYRGGPMRYAEEVGLAHVAARVHAFHAELGHWWKPSRLLLERASTGRGFRVS